MYRVKITQKEHLLIWNLETTQNVVRQLTKTDNFIATPMKKHI